MRFGTVVIALVLAGTAFLLFYQLGHEPFQDYDEATYAEVTTESLASHHFFSFTFLDRNYFNKPPLLFWLTDASQSVIKDSEFADRLPSALSGIALVIVLMLLAYEATQSAVIAGFAGGILATTSSFIEPARQVRFDILVSLCIMAAVYAFARAFEDRRWFLAFGALIALAILSKGPLAVFALIAVMGIAIAHKRINWLWDGYFWGGVALCLLLVVPWHLYETLRFGMAFWEEYLGDQIVDRVGQTLFNGPSNAAYVGYLFQFAAPWAELFVACVLAAPFLWKRMSVKVRALFLASIIGAAAVLAVCFLSKTKAISYLIPLYPFVALAIALVCYELSGIQLSGIRTAVATLCVCLCLYGFYLSIYNGFHINPYYVEEIALADQEQTIADTLRADHPPTFYVYNVTTLGSIMYYSRLLKPLWLNAMPPPVGSYVLVSSDSITQFKAAYPTLTVRPLYQGSYLTLVLAGG